MTAADLVEIALIERLKYRYMRCLDQKLWDEMAECLTADAVAAYSGGKYPFEGRDAILEFFRHAMGATSFLSSHRVHHPEIDLTSPTTAQGTWALDDVVVDASRDFALRGAAFYTDEYVKRDGRWLIARSAYKRTFEEVWSRNQPGPHRPDGQLVGHGRSQRAAGAGARGEPAPLQRAARRLTASPYSAQGTIEKALPHDVQRGAGVGKTPHVTLA